MHMQRLAGVPSSVFVFWSATEYFITWVSPAWHTDSKPPHAKQLNLQACCILIAKDKIFQNNFAINF